MNFTKDQTNETKPAKSVDELLPSPNDNDTESSKKQTLTYFDKLKNKSELKDEDLDAVAGGKNDYYGDYYIGQEITFLLVVEGGSVRLAGTIKSASQSGDKWYYSIGYHYAGSDHTITLSEDQIQAA